MLTKQKLTVAVPRQRSQVSGKNYPGKSSYAAEREGMNYPLWYAHDGVPRLLRRDGKPNRRGSSTEKGLILGAE